MSSRLTDAVARLLSGTTLRGWRIKKLTQYLKILDYEQSVFVPEFLCTIGKAKNYANYPSSFASHSRRLLVLFSVPRGFFSGYSGFPLS